MDDYVKMMDEARRAGTEPPVRSTPAQERMSGSVYYLRQHFHEVPVLVVPTIEGRFDGSSVFEQASRWGSILPAVWSFMLALRSRGMGSAWTTLHLHREAEMADLLGIPADEVTQAGMFPVAFTVGEEFRPADRSASETTVRWNHW
jgi:nitroreductase